MSESRIFIETPCEQCGLFEAHDIHGWYGPLRRELTIDYVAALSEADDRGVTEDGHNLNGPTLGAIVDAALHLPTEEEA